MCAPEPLSFLSTCGELRLQPPLLACLHLDGRGLPVLVQPTEEQRAEESDCVMLRGLWLLKAIHTHGFSYREYHWLVKTRGEKNHYHANP